MSQSRKILVGVAWPYANGEQHIGHIAGAYLPPDIFSRYQRMIGNEVLMVSGSDTHGTPVTVRAESEGSSPAAVVERFHTGFVESYLKLGLTFDLFTHTDTQNHWDVTQKMFSQHRDKGYIYNDTQQQLYDPQAKRFLPDRYVEGTCPFCASTEARGDQCDNCGRTYEATELKQPRSRITGNTDLEVRDTEHFFLDLGKLQPLLKDWLQQEKSHWRANVLNFSRTQVEQETLRGRPITRDLEWGVSIPLEGYEDKRIYVWYDAVIGYFSAAIEWATLNKTPDKWREWWDPNVNSEARAYYFIGKDNIPFHAMMWPAMLLGYEGLNLPYDVPANEYLNMYGRKFSKSRGHIISIQGALERYQADAWRYALTAIAPEASDVDFTWDDFVERVNNELLANWGNLVNRVLGFTSSRFKGSIPEPGPLDAKDQALLDEVKAGFQSVGDLYNAVKPKMALNEVRRLSQQANQYFHEKEPWKTIKTDPQLAATTIYVALQAIDWLKLLWAPILPHTSQQLHELLGYDGQLFGRQYTETVEDARGSHVVLRYDHSQATGVWEPSTLQANRALPKPAPLFVKLDDDVAEQESERQNA
jgi:methionyl-tRNA synthetase